SRLHFLEITLTYLQKRIRLATAPAVPQAQRSPTSLRLPPRPSLLVVTRPGHLTSSQPPLPAPLTSVPHSMATHGTAPSPSPRTCPVCRLHFLQITLPRL